MASLTKTERALRGPGLFEITLGVVLSISLGGLIAALYLVFKPVEAVKELPKEPELGAVYFLQGATDPGKARQWMRKRQMLGEGGKADISFNEEELNAWIASVMPEAPPKPKAAAKEGDKGDASGLAVVMGRPNFRIRDGVLQIGVPTTINAFGLSLSVIFQARGHFEKGADGYVFTDDELYVGSLPTHRVPGLNQLIVNRVMAAEQIPEDLSTAWRKLSLVAVEGSELHLSLP